MAPNRLLQVALGLSSPLLSAMLFSCTQRDTAQDVKRQEHIPYASLKFDSPKDIQVQALLLELYGLKLDSGSGVATRGKAEAICKELAEAGKMPDCPLSIHVLMALQSEKIAQLCEIGLLELLVKPNDNPAFEIEWAQLYRWIGIVLTKARSSKNSIPDLEKSVRYRALAIDFIRSIYPRARKLDLPLPRINDPKAEEAAEAWLDWVQHAITNQNRPANLHKLLEELGSLENDIRSEDKEVSYKAVKRAKGIQEQLLRLADSEGRGIADGILDRLSSRKDARFTEIYLLELLAKIQGYLAPYDVQTDGMRLRFLLPKAFAAKTSFKSYDLRSVYRVLVAEFLDSVAESGWGHPVDRPSWPSMDDSAHEEKMDAYLEWLGKQL